jgi:hypothetical protein
MKKKSQILKYLNFGIIFSLFLFSSCQKSDPTDCFKSTGEEITETRGASYFNKIVLEDNVNLVLSQSEEYAISVKGGKNVLKKVRTDINNEVLNIKNNNSCNWMRSFDREITVYANVKILNHIEYRGSGDISSTNTITGDSLQLNVWEGAGKVDLNVDLYRNYIYFHIGTANIHYSGNAYLSYISLSSFGPIYAENLSTRFSYVSNKGSNLCYVNSNLQLEATITSLGDIYYFGNPEIILYDTGEGRLINANE